MNENQQPLGKLAADDAERDAVHVAIFPTTSEETLHPGQPVAVCVNGQATADPEGVGIVDPFLGSAVYPGQRFFVCLYPNTVTGMRHHWAHPSFSGCPPTAPSKEESETWLRNFCDHEDTPGYEPVMAALRGEAIEPIDEVYGSQSYRIDDKYFMWWGRDAHSEIPPEFWLHAEIVTGLKFDIRPESFACSC